MQSGHKNHHYILAGVAATLLLTAPQAQAASPQQPLPPIMVTADRVASDATRISANTTLISQQEIKRSQKTNVAELLREQTGIDVATTGGSGKATSVFIRGANSGQTLVLIDGVRVGSATTGAFDWGNLSTADIDHIEIVRGPQSSLYGADAMGGVIQIFTRKGKVGSRIQARSEIGSYGSASLSSTISGGNEGGVSYALTADSTRTDGVSAAAKGTEPDPYRQTTVSGQMSLPVGNGALQLIARNVDGRTGLDGFGPKDVSNFTSSTKQTVLSAKMDYPINDSLESNLQLSRSTDEVIGRDPAGGFNNSDFRTRIDQFTWQNHLDLDDLSLILGVDIHRDRGSSSSAKFSRSLTQRAGFTSLAWHHALLDLNGAIRYDNNSAANNKTTYRAGLALHPLKGIKVTANYGTGFKSPSINDLYFPTSAFSGGNIHLKSENSRGWDAGVAYRIQKAQTSATMSITWFDQRYRDLISWQSSPTGFYFPSNIGKARTKGWEFSAKLGYGPAYLDGNWSYLSAKDSLSGNLLARRAKEKGNIRVGIDIASGSVEINWQIVGPRFSSANNTKPMKGYNKGDIRTSYAINPQWKMTARVNNITNKHYEEVSGYGVLGRAWYGGVAASF